MWCYKTVEISNISNMKFLRQQGVSKLTKQYLVIDETRDMYKIHNDSQEDIWLDKCFFMENEDYGRLTIEMNIERSMKTSDLCLVAGDNNVGKSHILTSLYKHTVNSIYIKYGSYYNKTTLKEYWLSRTHEDVYRHITNSRKDSFHKDIVSILLNSKSGSTIFIENPEIFLSPQGQCRLCEFFIDTINRGIKLIIETNSDHIFNGIRVGLAKNKINLEQVVAYNVYNENKEYKFSEIKLGKMGRIECETTYPFEQFDIDLNKILGLDETYDINNKGGIGG